MVYMVKTWKASPGMKVYPDMSSIHSEGSGCRTAVECTPHDTEVVGLNPAGYWAFYSLLYPISSASLIQVPQGGATLLIFL